MISEGRALDPDDDRTLGEKQQEARTFLKHQGTISFLSLVGLVIFAVYPNTYVVLGIVIFVYVLARILDKRGVNSARIAAKDKTVLITGCDRGIGHALAKQLASLDVTVFAGCLKSTGDGATSLKMHSPDRLHVLQMDVTCDDEVKAALDYVNQVTDGKGLWGLVNNAGIRVPGDVELTTMEQFERTINVNQLGMIRVTKTFLPLIRKQKGRLINVTSVKGRLSCPYYASYGMTKFAGETFSDTLRQEMRKFGVQVIIVEPCNFCGVTGMIETKRLKHDARDMWRALPREARDTYGKEYVDHHVKATEQAMLTSSQDITLVTSAMEDALFTVRPRARYMIGGSNSWYDSVKWRAMMVPFLPEWFMDGLQLHDVRGYPTPEALIGQEDH